MVFPYLPRFIERCRCALKADQAFTLGLERFTAHRQTNNAVTDNT
jgi:hypothetical protein